MMKRNDHSHSEENYVRYKTGTPTWRVLLDRRTGHSNTQTSRLNIKPYDSAGDHARNTIPPDLRPVHNTHTPHEGRSEGQEG